MDPKHIQGLRYQLPLSPNAKKKYFWHKKTLFCENVAKKKPPLKKSAPKNAI